MTEGDNRNVMSAQLATEALDARQVIAKINDPLRASAYAELGIATLCRTNLMASAVSDFLGLGLTFGPGLSPADRPAPRRRAPRGRRRRGQAAVAGRAGRRRGRPAATGVAAAAPAGATSTPPDPLPAAPPRLDPTPAPVAPATAREG